MLVRNHLSTLEVEDVTLSFDIDGLTLRLNNDDFWTVRERAVEELFHTETRDEFFAMLHIEHARTVENLQYIEDFIKGDH